MKAKHYFRAIPRQSRWFWLFAGLMGIIQSSNAHVHGGQTNGELLALLLPAIFAAAALGNGTAGSLDRPAFALLPGIRRQILRWDIPIGLAVAALWGGVMHLSVPRIPAAVGFAVSAAIMTFFPAHGWNPISAWQAQAFRIGLIAGLGTYVLAREFLSRIISAFSGQLTAVGLAGGALAIYNLWSAFTQRPTPVLERKAGPATKPIGGLGRVSENVIALRVRLFGHGDYSPRGNSLGRWVNAIHQESEAFGHARGLLVLGACITLALPLFPTLGGFPRAWYNLVYDWESGGGPLLAVFLWLGVMVLGYFVPLPRRFHLYPIPRVRRANLAFATSVFWWGSLVLVWICGPLLAATLTGLVSGLPVSFAGAVRFVAPSMMALPIVAFLRWSALQYEGISDLVMLGVCIVAIPAAIIGWALAANLPAVIAVIVCAAVNGIGLTIYHALLHDIYVKQDLIRPGADEPLIKIGLSSVDGARR